MRVRLEVDRKEVAYFTEGMEYVMVEFTGPLETYLLPLKVFENHELENSGWEWLFNVKASEKYVAVQSNFLVNFYFRGFEYSWEPHKSYVQDPSLLFARNDTKRFYQDYRLWDTSFLYFRDEPVCRPMPLQLGENRYILEEVKKHLSDHPKTSHVRITETNAEETPAYGDKILELIYHPTEEDFRKLWAPTGIMDALWVTYHKDRAKRQLGLEKFLRPQFREENSEEIVTK